MTRRRVIIIIIVIFLVVVSIILEIARNNFWTQKIADKINSLEDAYDYAKDIYPNKKQNPILIGYNIYIQGKDDIISYNPNQYFFTFMYNSNQRILRTDIYIDTKENYAHYKQYEDNSLKGYHSNYPITFTKDSLIKALDLLISDKDFASLFKIDNSLEFTIDCGYNLKELDGEVNKWIVQVGPSIENIKSSSYVIDLERNLLSRLS